MDYIWLIVVVFGIISAITNKGKTKSTDTPSNMPTFGGGEERSLRPRPDSSDETMAREGRKQQEVYTHSDMQQPRPSYESDRGDVMEVPNYPSPDYETGEGVSHMWEDTTNSLDREIQKDIERVTAALDKISAPTSPEWNAYDNTDEESKKTYSSGMAKQAVNGIIWAEILGTPRSKRPYFNRKS